MKIFDYIINSGLKLVQISQNQYAVGDKQWTYDPEIESLVPDGYKEPWAREVVKMLRVKNSA